MSIKHKKFGKFIYSARKIDRFSSPVKMNVNGQTEISSWPGALVTIFLYLTLAAYAYQRFNKLIFRENPDIQVATIENKFDIDYTLILNELDFKIAFGVNDYKSG